MTKRDRMKIKKEKEMRTKEISKMISEGGLGSDEYYEIVKDKTETDDRQYTKDGNKPED